MFKLSFTPFDWPIPCRIKNKSPRNERKNVAINQHVSIFPSQNQTEYKKDFEIVSHWQQFASVTHFLRSSWFPSHSWLLFPFIHFELNSGDEVPNNIDSMDEVPGALGSSASLALRFGQTIFSSGSILFMSFHVEFYSYTSFW